MKKIKGFERFILESKEYATSVIALFNEKGQLLALRRGMADAHGNPNPWKPGFWNITGGQVGDHGSSEDPKDAAMREALEETGLVPMDVRYWGEIDTSGSPEACGKIYYFTGKVKGDPVSSDGENSGYKYIDRKSIDDMDWVPFLTDFSGCDLSRAKFKKSFLHEAWN